MTHQNHQTNGASLEDCHTNFFALTELCGIKWRKLTWGGGGGGGGGASPLEDPVLSSYARCLAGDVLCVWRRVAPPAAAAEPDGPAPPPAPPPLPLSLDSAKELWIFWYGEEPDLTELVSPELTDADGDQGSWELGLSYECRSLLFKALHNLIERCLLSRDFVRLGKWFVQPYDGDEDDNSRSCWHLSFSFAFFVHGESTVCASVDVRQHPPVRRLATHKPPPHNTKVILAPFGLAGSLVDAEVSTAGGAVLDAWRHFYPLEEGASVEVAVGGVRMRYPARYTLLTSMDAPAPRHPAHAPSLLAHRTLTQLGLQDSELIGGVDPTLDVKPTKEWEFVDTTRRTSCTCSKCGSSLGHGTPGGGSPGSCGGGSPCGGPSPAPPSAPAPPTPRAAPLPLPHTPAPTPPQLPHTPHTPHTPRPSQMNVDSPEERLKRPILALQETEPDPLEEERPLDLLYDYTTMNAWLNHPVKKLKREAGCAWEWWEEVAGGRRGEDLYAGHTHTSMAPVEPTPPPPPQPEDEAGKETKNLFTSDGLQASYKDLDQIFDNSDDTSGDETVRLLQVHTPPDSNKGLTEEGGLAGVRAGRGAGAVRPEELCKMFPTPPSLEPSLQASPSAFSLPEPEHATLTRCGSPPDETIQDWSYVFKPPTICNYVGASKYAALSGLSGGVEPSHCVYRPSWQGGGGAPAAERAPRVAAPTQHAAPRTPRTPHHNLHSVGSISQPASVCVSAAAVAASPGPSPAASSSSPPAQSDACALLLNLLLADTAINIFRDHNFDSCAMCVCNAGPKVVGNIRGADSRVYLWGSPLSPDSPSPSPAPPAPPDEEPIRCNCGFSAVVNRRLAHRAGLFYEDEMEITGLAEDPAEYKREGGVFCDPDRNAAAALMELVREQCGVLGNSASALQLCAAEAAERLGAGEPRLHLLEFADCGDAAALALEAAAGRAAPALHRWPFLRAPAPAAGRDVVRLMRRLQPLLQDAIQKKCSTRMWDAVAGPLTWRQFHRLAGRGTEDLCEPQPVPPLLVGHDRDWVTLSPHALHYWDRLLLEPYSYARDTAYVVLLPDNPALVPRVRAYFRDLSTAYEQCRLGRHAPLARLAKDGLLRIPRHPRPEPLDDWFNNLPEGTTADILRLYAQTCRGVLAPLLGTVPLDHTLLEPEGGCGARLPPAPAPERPTPSPMAPPEHPPTPTNADHDGESNSSSAAADNCSSESGATGGEEEGSAPCVVVYLLEPGAGGERRTACLAMLRAASSLLHALPDHVRPHVSVQLISWESIMEAESGERGGRRRGASLRALALAVFSQCRRQLQHLSNIKSLTGFGTAANADLFLKNKDEKNRMPYRLYVPPYVLAPSRPLKDIAETFGQPPPEASSVLYLAYCLSADQSWLLAVATDGRGELLESVSINVHVPGRARRRRAPPARRLGLTKLMDFTLGVMSQAAQPWRLVVGRIGRIGHGELKGWSWLLSRKNLVKASQSLREVCASCSLLYPGGAPAILSACLVSTEPDAALRLLADQFTPDERFSQAAVASNLSTPQDVSCTHILVFPTSATTQSTQTAFQEQHINGPELGDDELFSALNDDMPDGIESMNDFSDIFNGWEGGAHDSPGGSPGSDQRRGGGGEGGASRPGSPGRPANHPHSPMSEDAARGGWEEVGALLQQPLALGYLVSTAPLGPMPRWWWAACPHAAPACPAFLKNALHLHSSTAQAGDDLLQQPPPQSALHPLDSHYTTDVLRYVLEGYNALSWLALDPRRSDRLSCLPAHVQALMRLYHLTDALV